MDDYSLTNSYVPISGGGIRDDITKFANTHIGGNAVLSLAIIVALMVIIVWLLIWKCKEGFNPTQTLRFQQMDGLGQMERLDSTSPDRSASAFAQQVQDVNMGSFNIDPNAPAGAPGSLGYQILNSPDFNCAHRTPIGNNAWDWMTHVAKENLAGGKPKNDSDFSKVLTGY
jgi:hypothetical protein